MTAQSGTVKVTNRRLLYLILGSLLAWLFLGPLLGGLAALGFAVLRKSLPKATRIKLGSAATLSILYGLVFSFVPWWLVWLPFHQQAFSVTHG